MNLDMDNPKVPHITCEHLRDLKEKKAERTKEHVVLDLRDSLEFESGHIKGSINIPQKELESNIGTLIPDKGARVIVIIGPTQEQEIEEIHIKLVGLGYKEVEFLAGGFDKWCEIASIELESDLLEQTPEEKGFVGEELTDIDPEDEESEPLF